MRVGARIAATLVVTAFALVPASVAQAMRVTFKGKGEFAYHLVTDYGQTATTDITSGFRWTTVYAQAPVPGSRFALPSYQIGADPLPISAGGQPSYGKSSGSGDFHYSYVNGDQNINCSAQLTPVFPGAFVQVQGRTLTVLAVGSGGNEGDQGNGFVTPTQCNGQPFNWYSQLNELGVGQNSPDPFQNSFPLTRITLSKADLNKVLVRRAVQSQLDTPPPLPANCNNPDASTTSCSISYDWTGTVTVCNSNVDPAKLKTLSPEMRRRLGLLFQELENRNACYVLQSAFRSETTQRDLYDRWHHIADHHANDPGICQQLHQAGFAQCPHGSGPGGVARGGPAKPGRSRHEHHEAADLDVVWPQNGYDHDLGRLRAAAHASGLCGPPASDPVHVELPYKGKGDKKPRCHFD